MFVVLLNYLKPIDIVDQHLVSHRDFLEEGYRNNFLIASGPQNPRTGGVLLSQLEDRTQLEDFLQRDPFARHEVAEYKIIEFTPVKHHPDFAKFLKV